MKDNNIKKLFIVLKEAGQCALDYQKGDLKSQMKSDGSPVTDGDKATQSIIEILSLEEFKDLSPVIVGEEEGKSEWQQSIKSGTFMIVIDPIDGTKAYKSGLDTWCVSVALAQRTETGYKVIVAGISAPAYKNGKIWIADKESNQALQMDLDGGTVEEIKIDSSRNSTGIMNVFSRSKYDSEMACVKEVLQKERNLEQQKGGSPALSIMRVLKGDIDLLISGEDPVNSKRKDGTDPHIWNTIAAQFIYEIAGGLQVEGKHTAEGHYPLLKGEQSFTIATVYPDLLNSAYSEMQEWTKDYGVSSEIQVGSAQKHNEVESGRSL